MEGNKTLERAVRVYYHIMKIYHPTNLMAQFLLKGNTADRKQANIASSAKITGPAPAPLFQVGGCCSAGDGEFLSVSLTAFNISSRSIGLVSVQAAPSFLAPFR